MSDLLSLHYSKAKAELECLAERMRSCSKDSSPVAGSGNPLADIFLVKASPDEEEESASVAFAGNAGEVVFRCVERLSIPCQVLYGTNLMKCGRERNPDCMRTCGRNLVEELLIVQPKLVFLMGESVFATVSNMYDLQARYSPGRLEQVPGGPRVIASVDFHEAVSDEEAKKALWRDLQTLGAEYKRLYSGH